MGKRRSIRRLGACGLVALLTLLLGAGPSWAQTARTVEDFSSQTPLWGLHSYTAGYPATCPPPVVSVFGGDRPGGIAMTKHAGHGSEQCWARVEAQFGGGDLTVETSSEGDCWYTLFIGTKEVHSGWAGTTSRTLTAQPAGVFRININAHGPTSGHPRYNTTCQVRKVTASGGLTRTEAPELSMIRQERAAFLTAPEPYWGTPDPGTEAWAAAANTGKACNVDALRWYVPGGGDDAGVGVNGAGSGTSCAIPVGRFYAGSLQPRFVISSAIEGSTVTPKCGLSFRVVGRAQTVIKQYDMSGANAKLQWMPRLQPGVLYDAVFWADMTAQSKCWINWVDGVSGATPLNADTGGGGGLDDPFGGIGGGEVIYGTDTLPELVLTRPPLEDCWADFSGWDYLNPSSYGAVVGCVLQWLFVPTDGIFGQAAGNVADFAAPRVPFSWAVDLFGGLVTIGDSMSAPCAGPGIKLVDGRPVGGNWCGLASGVTNIVNPVFACVVTYFAARKVWAGAPWNDGKETA